MSAFVVPKRWLSIGTKVPSLLCFCLQLVCCNAKLKRARLVACLVEVASRNRYAIPTHVAVTGSLFSPLTLFSFLLSTSETLFGPYTVECDWVHINRAATTGLVRVSTGRDCNNVSVGVFTGVRDNTGRIDVSKEKLVCSSVGERWTTSTYMVCY